MQTRLALLIGLLLCNAASPQVLQDVSLPQSAQAASMKAAETPTNTYFVMIRSAIRKRHNNLMAQVAPSPRVQALLPVVDQEGIELRHKKIADEVLRLMPAKCRDTLKNFYVRYNNPEQRGLAGKTTLIISGNVPDAEFRALMIHEIGHVFDLNDDQTCLGGTSANGISLFKDGTDIIYKNDPSIDFYSISWQHEKMQRANVNAKDFVTGYAATDAFEDLAESFAYFILQNAAFKERAQSNRAIAAKYNWLNKHFSSVSTYAIGQDEWQGQVPWDATKLAYKWNPKEIIAAVQK